MIFTKILGLVAPLSLIISSTIFYGCGHEYIYIRTIKENDCTNYGIAEFECKYCSNIKQVKIKPNPTKHIWDEGEIIIKATCINSGITKYCCTCNSEHTKEVIVEVGSHDLSDHHDHEFPTFRTCGLREHYLCHYCNQYILPDKKTVVNYTDLIIKKYDSTKIDFVENEIKELSLKYNDLIESDIITIKNIYIDMSALNDIEKYYLKKEVNDIMNMTYYDSFTMIVNKYNSRYIN